MHFAFLTESLITVQSKKLGWTYYCVNSAQQSILKRISSRTLSATEPVIKWEPGANT